MATIVRHAKTGTEFVLIGTGFGAWGATMGNWMLGDLVTDRESGTIGVVAVASDAGEVGFLPARDVVVVSVDGVPIERVLHTARPED